MRKIQILICVLVLWSNLIAGDYADLRVIGFSADGKYLAFEEWGEENSFGEGGAMTYYIETAKNSYAQAPSVFDWTRESYPKSRKILLSRYRRSVAANLKRFAIVPGNAGKLVAAHLLNDLSFVKPVMREDYFERNDGTQTDALMPDYEGGFISRGEGIETVIVNPYIISYWQDTDKLYQNTKDFYKLTLRTSSAAGTECGNQTAYKIELTLQDNTKHRETKPQILQKDADILPSSRYCPFGYKIERVYLYKNKIAVFLNVFSEDVRGTLMRYLVVTGELKEKL